MARLTAPPPIPDGLPGSWRSLLSEATATDPAHRPDAAALEERLLVLTSGTPMTAPAPTLTMPLTMPVPTPTPSPLPTPLVIAAGRRWSDWLRARPSEQRWVAAVIAAMAMLVVIAGFATDGDPTLSAAADASQAPSSTPRSQTARPPPSPSPPQTTDATRVSKADQGASSPTKGSKDGKKRKKGGKGKKGDKGKR